MEIRPHRTINRKKTKKIKVGNIFVGGDSQISVQSMTNTLTTNIKETVKQINDDFEKTEIKTFIGNPNGTINIIEFFDYNCGFCKSMFSVILKTIDNKTHEPFEELTVDLPEQMSGVVIEKISKRKGIIQYARRLIIISLQPILDIYIQPPIRNILEEDTST